jgi:hypothetical protein
MSGRSTPATEIAWAPLLTAMTSMSSSANVSSITFWMVTLSSASSSFFGTVATPARRVDGRCR